MPNTDQQNRALEAAVEFSFILKKIKKKKKKHCAAGGGPFKLQVEYLLKISLDSLSVYTIITAILSSVTVCYFTALCLPMGKMREIFNLHFLARPGVFQANHCVVTKVEVPNSMLTCIMRIKFATVSVYQAV